MFGLLMISFRVAENDSEYMYWISGNRIQGVSTGSEKMCMHNGRWSEMRLMTHPKCVFFNEPRAPYQKDCKYSFASMENISSPSWKLIFLYFLIFQKKFQKKILGATLHEMWVTRNFFFEIFFWPGGGGSPTKKFLLSRKMILTKSCWRSY